MSKNKIAFDDGLGDIDSILHNQSVSDLSWLVVDESAYRALETLPKQNLDIIPELTRALTVDPAEDIQKVIPLRPHVIVNENPASQKYQPADYLDPIRNRVAGYIMNGINKDEINAKLSLEFPPDAIRFAGKEVRNLEKERGLLGNVYIDSQFIAKCDQEANKERKNIVACTKKALFVLSKPQCNNCVKNINGRCASLQKTIVDEIPYGPKLAAHYSDYLFNSRQATSLNNEEISWKDRIRLSFLASASKNPDGVQTVQTRQNAEPVIVKDSDIHEFLTRTPKQEVRFSSSYLKYAKRMMSGKNDVDFLVASGDPDLVRLSSEYGLMGNYYVDMDVLGGCKHTEKFVKDHGLNPSYIVRRNAQCTMCNNLADGSCARLCERSKMAKVLPPYTKGTFIEVLKSKLDLGEISEDKFSTANSRLASDLDYKSLTAQLFLYKAAPENVIYKEAAVKSHYISPVSSQKTQLDSEDVRRFISHLMNTGLKGSALTNAVLNRYDQSDLKAHSHVGQRLASEEGLQGSYYLDPTAYKDYGRGCSEGAALFKNRGPKNIMASSQCTGCTMQNAPGWCSRYCKSLIRSVPKSVRSASKRHLPVVASAPIVNPVESFELSHEMDVSPSNLHQSVLDINLSTNL